MPAKKPATKSDETFDLASILAKRGGKYLSDDEKHEFARDETPFTITDISKGKGSFGPRWDVAIKAGKREAVLTLPFHDARDEQMEMLARLIKKAGPQGPVTLSIRDMENGNSWLSLNAAKNKNGR